MRRREHPRRRYTPVDYPCGEEEKRRDAAGAVAVFFCAELPTPPRCGTRRDTRECKNGSRNLGAACLRELEFGTFLVGVAAWSELGVWRFVPLKRRGPRSLLCSGFSVISNEPRRLKFVIRP